MMLLANAPRTTDDIDVYWLEEGEGFHKARLALRDAVQAIARRYTLPPNWFNYLTQLLIYDKIIMPRGKLWKRYGPLLRVCPAKGVHTSTENPGGTRSRSCGLQDSPATNTHQNTSAGPKGVKSLYSA